MVFYVVHFVEDKQVDAVPKSWYRKSNATCYYPPDVEGAHLMAKNEEVPGKSWTQYPATILGVYGTNDYLRLFVTACKCDLYVCNM